jgi:Ca2+-binding EF-hand superfamily protein
MKNVWCALVIATVVFAGNVFAEDKKNSMDTDGDGKVSKEEYLASRMKIAEKNGAEFNQKANEKKFAARDKNEDGFLTGDELVKKKKPAKEPEQESSDEE